MRPPAYLGLVLLLNAFALVPASGGPSPQDDEVVAVAAGRKITQKDLEERISNLPDGYREVFETPDGRARLARELARIEVFSQEAVKIGLDKDPGLQTRLSELTKAVLAAEYARAKISSRVSVSEEEARAYYGKNREEYSNPERIYAPKIFVRVLDSDSFEAVTQKRERAERARRFLMEGADFRKTAWELSDEQPDAQPDYYARGRLVPEIEPIVFALNKGEVSPVMKVRDGFVVYKIEDRIPPSVKPFDDVKSEIVQQLREERLQEMFEAAERALFDKYQVVFSPGIGPLRRNPKEQSIAVGKISMVVLAAPDSAAKGVIATLLIEGSWDGGAVEQIAIALRADTTIARQAGSEELHARLDDLRAGQFVRARCAGRVELSSPSRGEAKSLVILERQD
ncbi:MAG: peptidylprolyl isomerase [Acidobacteriota bacterium]